MIVTTNDFWEELGETFVQWNDEKNWTHASILREIRIAVETFMPGSIQEVDAVSRYIGERLVPPVQMGSLPMKCDKKYFLGAMNIGRRMMLEAIESKANLEE